MLTLKQFLEEKKKNPCWDGYKRVPGKKDYEDGSCVKEEDLDEIDRHGISKNASKAELKKIRSSERSSKGKKNLAHWLLNMHHKEEAEEFDEATYQGKKVPLNKPMAGDVKKSKVFVDPDGDGKAKKVNFGDKNMKIKKNIPARRKSFRARHNCDNPGPKDKARYWSCKAW